MAAVQVLGEPQHSGKRPHDLSLLFGEVAVTDVTAFRLGAAMIACDECNRFHLERLETAQVTILDEVIGVEVMPLVTNEHAGVVQDGGVLQPFTFVVGHGMDTPRTIEQHERQPRNLMRVIRPVVTAFCKFDHAAAPNVGIAVCLRDLLAVARDIVEHDPFP
jgi:hypothetical protein